MAKRKWKLSATSIALFKRCPYSFWIRYILGLIPTDEKDALRIGTNWHKVLEIIGLTPDTQCPDCAGMMGQIGEDDIIDNTDPECPICGGSGLVMEDRVQVATDYIYKAYENKPEYKADKDWYKERTHLLYALSGYTWYWSASEHQYEVLATEISFEIPLINPETGAKTEATIQGKIDKLVRLPDGTVAVNEYKTTSKDISQDSQYWNRLHLDTQTKLYPYAAQKMQLAGELEQYGIKADDPLIRTVLYDAHRNPGIGMVWLTQKASKEFVETGMYLGKKFGVIKGTGNWVHVDGIQAESKSGKKEGTFAIMETPEMLGTRLLNDMTEQPDRYFARRMIARTDQELRDLELDLYNIYQTIKFMHKNERWWQDEQQCEATWHCDNKMLCYTGVDPTKEIPEGYKSRWEDKKT